MYQGKFTSNKGSKQAQINAELLAARQEKLQKKAAPAARQSSPAQPVNRRNPAQPRSAGQAPQRPAPRTNTPAPATRKKGPRTGSVIFYTLYFLLIFVFIGGTFFGLNWLKGWLVDWEASQPTTKAQEVFNQLFANPNWGELYDRAGLTGTEYEGKEAFVSYMEKKVGGSDLSYMETSTGLSQDKKYLVKLDGEKVASFTLEGQTESPTDIPDWTLGKIELFYECKESFLIQKLSGHTASVNGVALDDSFTIQIATTKAEAYLPIGVPGVSTCIQKIDGLMATPVVTVTNRDGEEMEVVYDEAAGMFIEQTDANTIGADEENVVIDAARIYAQFMIKRANRGDVAKYFDPTTSTYSQIVGSELFSTTNNGCSFKDEAVTEYCRYSENLFSARVNTTMAVKRTDGTLKDYNVNTTLFFSRKDANSKWMVYDMTNEDVQQPVGKVRLTFMEGSNVLDTGFYDTNARSLQTPVVSAPSGKIFTGWVHESVDENGKTIRTVVFTPDETGLATLSAASQLEPMTVYALFEDAAAPAAASQEG